MIATLGAIFALVLAALGWGCFWQERRYRVLLTRNITRLYGESAINYVNYGERE